MHTRLKKEIDADLYENHVAMTDYKTGQNRYVISCAECCKTFYADRESFESINRAIEEGLDNPFLCNNCRREYEESAYEKR